MSAQEGMLLGNYTMRILDEAEFRPLFRHYRPLIFQTMLAFDVQQALSLEELLASVPETLHQMLDTQHRGVVVR